jgi:hypothetical protein
MEGVHALREALSEGLVDGLPAVPRWEYPDAMRVHQLPYAVKRPMLFRLRRSRHLRSVATMRALGVAGLGLFIGLIAGALLTSAVARPIVSSSDGEIAIGVGILLGAIMPVLGICGAVAAVVIDRKFRATR